MKKKSRSKAPADSRTDAPVVREIRRIRESIAKRSGNNLRRHVAASRRFAAQEAGKLGRPGPKRPKA
jgi:hypothetical protein